MIQCLENSAGAGTWTAVGFARGVRLAAIVMPAMAMFGVAFGAVAAQKGLMLFEAVPMSALVFAGASQFVALELWEDHMTASGIVALGVITATVNLRFLLMSATLRPWLGESPTWHSYPALALMTDPGWLLITRYRSAGGVDSAVFLGSGIALWLVWIAATAAGFAFGMRIVHPERFGLDLVMPCFFIVMLVPLWRGPRHAVPWLAAGTVALLSVELVPDWWSIVAGAAAGSLVAAILDGSD
jgi:predicted branched-subunit amino acid permease